MAIVRLELFFSIWFQLFALNFVKLFFLFEIGSISWFNFLFNLLVDLVIVQLMIFCLWYMTRKVEEWKRRRKKFVNHIDWSLTPYMIPNLSGKCILRLRENDANLVTNGTSNPSKSTWPMVKLRNKPPPCFLIIAPAVFLNIEARSEIVFAIAWG